MELSVLLLNAEQLIHQFCSVQLHVALSDPALVPISFDHWSAIIIPACPFALLRFAVCAKAVVVRIGFLIFQDAGMCDPLTCWVKLLCGGNDGVERDPRSTVLLPLLHQRIHGTFDEIERALPFWRIDRLIEPGGSLACGNLTRRSQSSPPVLCSRLHDKLPSYPFL